MKKITLISLTLLALILTACGAQATQAAPTQSELDTESKLILGTLKLDGTEQAVTAEQARELVIYWQVYQEISQSDTAAQEEVDGLLKQIEGAMSAEQMQAIEALGLTQRDVMTVMQEKSLMANMPVRSTTTDSTSTNTTTGGGFAPPDGGGPMMGAGGPPDMGGGFGGGNSSSNSSSSDSSSSDAQTTRTNPTLLLIDTLIEYLQGIG
ncbi:MAG: hypothetical protein ACOY0R_08030 [Chloroflexota bacterium]